MSDQSWLQTFISKLRERGILRVGALYAGVAWFVASAMDLLLPLMNTPDWVLPTGLIALAVGFPVALLVAWFRSHDAADGNSWAGPVPIAVAIAAALGISAVGYQWTDSIVPSSGPFFHASPDAPQVRIAVLPFRDTTPQAELTWLADGLTEEVRRQIIAWGVYDVFPGVLTPNNATDAFEMGASFLLTGRLQQQETNVLTSIELIHADSKRSVWHSEFTGDVSNPLELQQRLARDVARYFQESTVPAEGPSNPAAYATYLKTVRHAMYTNSDEAAYWLRRTLELDPQWYTGWRDLAFTQLQEFAYKEDASALDRVRDSIAQIPDPNYYYFQEFMLTAFGEGKLADAELMMAPLMESNLVVHAITMYAWLLNVTGLYQEAEPALKHATELLPTNPATWEQLAWARANLGNYESAIEAANQLATVAPTANLAGAEFVRIVMLPLAGLLDPAHDRLQKYVNYITTLNPDSAWYAQGMVITDLAQFHLALAENRPDAARTIAFAHANRGRNGAAALMLLRLGDATAAAEQFALEAPTAHYRLWDWMYWTTILTPELRQHPSVLAHEAAMGITPEWRLELCTRASNMPEHTRIRCDPEKYALSAAAPNIAR